MEFLRIAASDRVAVVHPDGSAVTYRELLRSADQAGRLLPHRRKALVALFGDREPGTLVTYVAALRQGHAVGWFGSVPDPAQRVALVRRFRPDVIVAPPHQLADSVPGSTYRPVGSAFLGVAVARQVGGPRPDVHPDTSVLLMTSGSMSSGRAVRLSGAAIAANSRAIAEALDIRPNSRAATALPLFYSYGLSVINSHFAMGASVLLTDAPASGTRFWREFAAAGCTIFPAVPLHLQWLTRTRRAWNLVPTLRAVTVSGARTSATLAKSIHEQAERIGFQFFKMYGQTEATARISVLQHEDLPARPDSVGRVVPGSTVVIEGDDGGQVPDGTEGHIIYRGPNAMQGYADSAADLSRPDEMAGTVDTRDLGFMADGFLHVTGRTGRFVKPGGRRLELDVVEELFSEVASSAVVGTDDERAHVFVEGGPLPAIEEVRSGILRQGRVGPDDLRIHFVASLPRRLNGKVDYRALYETAMAQGPDKAEF
ncbi:AMP-binding protein (plasmid) [Streptomyces viridifaciens]|nr:AMP-binding protein [Streptomyces viridifaciens]